MELKCGTYLQGSKYKIERTLGRGSFGITYLATARFSTDGNLGRMNVFAKVAIKEFFMSEVNSRSADGSSVEGSSGSVFSNYRKKFRREAENLSTLDHPNIVKVYDVFDENGTTYYSMEFLEGMSLDDYIKSRGSLPEDEAVSIAGEIGGALSYMHSKNMLHLDVKPKNVMRRADGGSSLIDFGLSKQYTDDGEPESSTSIGLGTPGYAPIEQAGYKQDGTFPATLDVYALGATLFKMLTGHRPPEASILFNNGFPLDELTARRVSDNTCTALRKAMAPSKKSRYQDVRSFLSGLTDIEGTSVEDNSKPRPQSQPRPSVKPERKHKWLWPCVAAVVAAVLIILLVPGLMPDSNDGGGEEVVVETVESMVWDSPLGIATYSGEVEPDTIEGSTKQIPNGRGVASLMSGEYEGSRYDGEFVHGKMQGLTIYTLKDGDTFVGTFKDNEYERGRYTVKSTGSYFEGTFKNGMPDNGKWYDKSGKLIE